MPAARIHPEQYPELAQLAVRGNLSHKGIAARFGVDPSTVTRTLRRPPVVALLDIERNRKDAAKRAKSYRARKRDRASAAERDPAVLTKKLVGYPPDTEHRRFVKCLRRDPETGAMIDTGTREMVKKGGRWYRITATCGLVEARERDWEGNPPPDFDPIPAFGPPGHPRPPLGHREPVVRMLRPPNERGIEVTSPVDLCEVEAREAEGWTRVDR
jgi:hypothetical protein